MIFETNSDSADAEKPPVGAVVTGTVEVVVAGAVVATGAVVVTGSGATVVVVTGLAVVVVTGLVVVVVTGLVVVVVTGVAVAVGAGVVVVGVDEATVTVGKLRVVVGEAGGEPLGTRIRAGLVGESVSSRVSSTGFGLLYATSRGASSTTTGGAIPTLATWIRRTHAAVALARAIARRMKVPTPITVPVGQSAWPDNPVVDCHSEWLYRPTTAIT
ncbi:MAG TPA: hypothetical protein VJQ79_16280 [Acidimicrobiia bacterium]|nr:hypothetical protein [Acidimicrobiia bacterium]